MRKKRELHDYDVSLLIKEPGEAKWSGPQHVIRARAHSEKEAKRIAKHKLLAQLRTRDHIAVYKVRGRAPQQDRVR